MRNSVWNITVVIAALVALQGCVGIVGGGLGAAMMGSAGVNWATQQPGQLPDHEDAKRQAIAAITRNLKDPESARFRDSTPFFKTLYNYGLAGSVHPESLWALCIEVNAKNSYGGYSGFEYWQVKFRNGRVVEGGLGVLPSAYDCKHGPADPQRRP